MIHEDGDSEYDAIDFGPMTSGPTARIVGQRARTQYLKQFNRSIRVADVVCRRGRRQLIAVAIGTPTNYVVPTTEDITEAMGDDFLASCGCGWDHAVVGTALRAAIHGLPSRGRRVPEIFVDLVERLPE